MFFVRTYHQLFNFFEDVNVRSSVLLYNSQYSLESRSEGQATVMTMMSHTVSWRVGGWSGLGLGAVGRGGVGRGGVGLGCVGGGGWGGYMGCVLGGGGGQLIGCVPE